MGKQLLPHDVTQEDRQRFCIWASTFRRPGDEVQKLGTINGAPVINRGLTLDGAADYIEYDLLGQFSLADPWSCHMVFYPDFSPTDDATYRFWSSSGDDYSLFKRANANGNVIQLTVGNTNIGDIAQATYAGLWALGDRNLISVVSTTGDTDVWLNGTQIMAADATAWSAVDATSLTVGAANGGGQYFDGRIESFHIYNTLLTELDHNAIWSGGGA